MQRPQFFDDEIYHIYNRGVDKRRVFLSDKDRLRFVHDLYEFNDEAAALNTGYYYDQGTKHIASIFKKPRKPLVEILSFCEMPNHFHLLVRQVKEWGITAFMRKLGTGYTNYFNQKYQRSGVLFQGKFKAVHVEKESHLVYLPHYIHLNALDIVMPEWRGGNGNIKVALRFLESYRWSSYLDYIGKKNFPSVIVNSPLQIYGSPTSIDYQDMIKEWLKEFNLSLIEKVAIEPMEVGLQ